VRRVTVDEVAAWARLRLDFTPRDYFMQLRLFD
jgi:hypothetical protein